MFYLINFHINRPLFLDFLSVFVHDFNHDGINFSKNEIAPLCFYLGFSWFDSPCFLSTVSFECQLRGLPTVRIEPAN